MNIANYFSIQVIILFFGETFSQNLTSISVFYAFHATGEDYMPLVAGLSLLQGFTQAFNRAI